MLLNRKQLRAVKSIQRKYGFTYLLGTSEKIDKSNQSGSGYLSFIMYLAPHELSGKNVCPWASLGCILGCLNLSGHGVYDSTQLCRINRTKMFFEHRAEFIMLLMHEIALKQRAAKKAGLKLAIRLNGTSDLVWEKIAPEIFASFPDVTFYDYSKSVKRMFTELPSNYSLTFSRSESNDADVSKVLSAGKKVAVVFSGKTLPTEWQGAPVINGDLTDERFLEDGKLVVGLLPKGKARKDKSGFVVQQ